MSGAANGAASAAEARAPRAIDVRSWVDLAVVAVLCSLGVLGFEASYGDQNFLVAGLGGIAVGIGSAIGAAFLRLPLLAAIALAIGAYFLFGTAFAMPGEGIAAVVPTAQTLAGLVIGAVFGWRDLLTVQTPVEAPYYMATVPYAGAWLIALTAALLTLRWFARKRSVPRAALVLAGPAVLYLVGVLFGTEQPFLAPLRGIAFGVVALAWLVRRQPAAEAVTVEGRGRLLRTRLIGVAIVLGTAVAVGGVGGWALQPAPEQRYVLREEVQPPFDPNQFASPLAGFREYTKVDALQQLMTIEGLPEGERLRLATMDAYTGIIWNVSGPDVDVDGSGSFQIVGRSIPEPTLATTGETTTVEVTVSGYDDVWLPSAGYPDRIELLDADSEARADDLRYNPTTGIALVTSGVHEGARYRVETSFQDQPSDEELQQVQPASVTPPPLANVPDVVTELAQQWAADADTPIDQLRAIELSLRTTGFLSHGREAEARSAAGHGSGRLVELLSATNMVGDQEQYATAFALMARALGYPARVVMGFAPPTTDSAAPVTVTGEDVTAWVEVPFEGVGWVAFDPTPEQTDVPRDEIEEPQLEPQPQVRQPPRVDDEDDDLLAQVDIDDTDRDDDDPFVLPAWVWWLGGAILVPAVLIGVPLLLVAAAKARRRRARRSPGGDRSSAGAWEELADRLSEFGYVVPTGTTRRGQADALGPQFATDGASAGTATLALAIDEDVFRGAAVPDATADARWRESDELVSSVGSGLGTVPRLLARFRYHRRSAKAARAAKGSARSRGAAS